MKYDFSGYATKNDLLCADGRVIRHDAFKDNDGQTVPLVWHHVHSDPTNVLGHVLLENRDDGVYAYGVFNNTDKGKHAREMVKNGDVTALSIFANKLQQQGNNVVHGMIREVSLVLTGANPGAFIDNLSFAHADPDGGYSSTVSNDEAVIYSGLENAVSLAHAEDEKEKKEDSVTKNDVEEKADTQQKGDKTVADVFNTLTDEQKDAVYFLIDQALKENGNKEADDIDDSEKKQEEKQEEKPAPKPIKHADDSETSEDSSKKSDDKTVQEVFDTLTDEQKDVVYFLIGQAVENATNSEDVKHDDLNGDTFMKHNVFDDTTATKSDVETLSHEEFKAIMEDAHRADSLEDVFIAHGITNIDVLFPEAQLVRPTPDMITRDMGWVDVFWNGVKRTPFSRLKSVYANLTAKEARAKGYVKGTQKVDQVVKLLHRKTNPTTVYKKQSIDRDDVVDITGLDVIAWIKQEMRLMLNEEICRACLVGDGRDALTDTDKIDEDCIRPVYGDDDVYTIYYETGIVDADTDLQKANKIRRAAIKARKDYKGSGEPIFFATNEVISDLLLATDTIGRVLYENMDQLKSALRVSQIVEVPVMEGVTRERAANATAGITAATMSLQAIILNPKDYTIGATKGGEVNFFDDFDIDFNKMKYLIETRCCGALTLPYSAIAIETEVVVDDDEDDGTH